MEGLGHKSDKANKKIYVIRFILIYFKTYYVEIFVKTIIGNAVNGSVNGLPHFFSHSISKQPFKGIAGKIFLSLRLCVA
jgi:hypothetical protein